MGFGADLRAVCERAKGRIDEVVRATAVGLYDGMQNRAPVDTGRLRANFVVGLGSQNASTTLDTNAEAARAKAQGALAAWKRGEPIYITNSLPYAVVAEYGLYGKPPGSANGPKTVNGFPKQAVGGFVRLTVQDFQKTLRKAASA